MSDEPIKPAVLSAAELTLLDLAALCACGAFHADEYRTWADHVLGAARSAPSNSRWRPVIEPLVACARCWRDGKDSTRELVAVRNAVADYFRERFLKRQRGET